MLTVPPRAKSLRRNETSELTHPIVAALNALPGVWASRNTNGVGFHRNGDPATWGLGTGSFDVIGCVDGLFFALEVKWEGKYPTPVQRRWRAGVARSGMYCAVVHSVDRAIAAVEECRPGRHRRGSP